MHATGTGSGGQPAAACAGACPAATALLGLDGLQVLAVTPGDDSWTIVDVATSPDDSASACPGCGMTASRRKEHVMTAPKDAYLGDVQVRLRWHKTRWFCDNPDCPRHSFTEAVPAVPRRCRMTTRMRRRLGACVGDDLMPVTAAAERYRVSERTVARAFASYAGTELAALARHAPPATAAGVDEFRRGKPATRTDPDTGEQVKTRSEWFTHLVDLDSGGTIGLAEGRTAAAETGLIEANPARLRGLRYLAMDCSNTYRSGAPAGLILVADPFHLVKIANRKIDQAFRRLGYRTPEGHADLGLPRPLHNMLRYNAEDVSREHLAKITEILGATDAGCQIMCCWIVKEELRRLLALRITRTHVSPAPSDVRNRLANFYLACAEAAEIPEVASLAKTIEKWQEPVINAVLTGYSNAKAEAHNRTAKLVARTARGFACPENQKQRVHMATTRKLRRGIRRCRSQNVARPP
jgi:transposase